MSLMWVLAALDVNEAASEYVAFKCGPTHYPATVVDATGVTHGVNREAFKSIVDTVKAFCQDAAERLIAELSSRFIGSSIMDALGVVYPQYWLQPHADDLFDGHFECLKNHYCT